MSIVNIEPIRHGELLATKITFKLPDPDGNYKNNNVINVLLNCGWTLNFEEDVLDLYKRHIQSVDVILITDGDFVHSGALLWLTLRFLPEPNESTPKILCTEGTYKFMRASLIDVLENVTLTSNFNHYNFDDLDLLNTNCIKLRYNETYFFTKKLENLQVKTSFRAINNGYSVGGAVWSISAGFNTVVCGDKIRVYPSTLLNGANVNDILKPDLLVLSHEEVDPPKHSTDPKGVEVCEDFTTLLDKLSTTLNNGGNVFFPMDVDYTLINLLVHLNMSWSTSQLSQFKIVLVSPIADKLLLFIGTCLEYMKTSIFHNFIKTLWNPLSDLSHIEMITSLTHLSKYRFRPTVFICTTSNVNFGFSNFLFLAISSYYKNLVVLTKPNESVTKYIFNQNRDASLPQYKLQINLNYKYQFKQDEVEEDAKETTGPDSYFQNYSNLSGSMAFHNASNSQNPELDSKNIQDYGVPFTDMIADPANPYGYTDHKKYVELQEEERYDNEHDENSQVDDYYRKYIDDTQKSLFDIDGDDPHDYQPKSDLMTKKFLFTAKSTICLVKIFSIFLSEPQMASLLYRTMPRNVVLIPTSDLSLESEVYLSKLLKCNLHSFYVNKSIKNEADSKKLDIKKRTHSVVSVELNVANQPVLLNLNLLSSVRNFFNRRPPGGKLKRGSGNYQGINSVLNSIEQWKYKNNMEKACQIVSKINCVEESQPDPPPPSNVLNCHTFWSDESNKSSKLELVLNDLETSNSETNVAGVKNSVESTFLVGDVSMSSYAKFMDDCLPNSVSLASGSAVINDKVKVSKLNDSFSNEWVIEGTLDPSFYLARKLLKKVHNRIEPIY